MAVQAVATWPAEHVLAVPLALQPAKLDPVPLTENLPEGQAEQKASDVALQAVPYVPAVLQLSGVQV